MTYEEFTRLAVHGAELSLRIGGTIIDTAKITINTTRSTWIQIYIVQDKRDGCNAVDLQGFTGAWAVTIDNFHELSDIVFKDKQSDLLLNI